jgi:hypothetical protein
MTGSFPAPRAVAPVTVVARGVYVGRTQPASRYREAEFNDLRPVVGLYEELG